MGINTGLGRDAATWPLARGTEGRPDRDGLSGWGEASGDITMESMKGYRVTHRSRKVEN